MKTKSSNSEWVNVTQLPIHTKREILVGEIFDIIAKRKQGFTIGANLDKPEFGYMVGTGILKRIFTDINRNDIENYVNKFFELCEIYQARIFLGGWISEKGEPMVEISQNFLDIDTAIEAGMQNSEYSIWDIQAGKEIVLKY